MKELICLTPFIELYQGDESIHDHVRTGYRVPKRVLMYLKTTKPYLMSPGIYEHPFIKGKKLLGPYLYCDDRYCWDRDTWKYVYHYGLVLPQDFIDHVMSDEGLVFLRQQLASGESWKNHIEEWKKEPGGVCLLPDDAGDVPLENF